MGSPASAAARFPPPPPSIAADPNDGVADCVLLSLMVGVADDGSHVLVCVRVTELLTDADVVFVEERDVDDVSDAVDVRLTVGDAVGVTDGVSDIDGVADMPHSAQRWLDERTILPPTHAVPGAVACQEEPMTPPAPSQM
jgi:hypothetical protein